MGPIVNESIGKNHIMHKEILPVSRDSCRSVGSQTTRGLALHWSVLPLQPGCIFSTYADQEKISLKALHNVP